MQKHSGAAIAVIGLGYVGLPLALLATRKGHRVVGIDINSKKVADINEGICPFLDDAISKQLSRKELLASVDFSLVREAEIIIICVPTPIHEDNSPNLDPLIQACERIAPHLAPQSLVIVESTVNPGVCENIALPTLERASGMRGGVDFMFSHCPERVNPGDQKWNVENIHRVIGSSTQEGLEKTLAFYRSILTADLHPMQSIREAEAVKIVENTFRDINIAFVNELALSFDRLGIDIVNVLAGASTKPFAFMSHSPGCGVGGHCIPVDPYYLIDEGRRNGFNHEFLSLARKINNNMPLFTVDLLERSLKEHGHSLSGSRVAVLGLAYKAGVDDMRESPSHKIIEELKRRGAIPVAFDPHTNGHSQVESLTEALSGSVAVIIATAHREFTQLMPADFLKHGVSIVVDGKNCLPKETYLAAGMSYRGMGR